MKKLRNKNKSKKKKEAEPTLKEIVIMIKDRLDETERKIKEHALEIDSLKKGSISEPELPVYKAVDVSDNVKSADSRYEQVCKEVDKKFK